ncbi:hypothetical protein DL764_007002 [Monosporascus ibericus]|uniref:Small EDRK-rich factor-like N-terminal domain-containing protein n=1 Tax=Monosporascus ibericus TaxID=155417 RepID=A0A4Q4T6F9_9PEZI|nr:hypothetical protein DL764_007002 [Monosporascus ibericus]
MGGGNGAKAAQKRERNQLQNAKKGPASQLKSNEASKKLVCEWCHLNMMVTCNRQQLEAHAQKDGKPFEACFPNWQPKSKK